MQYYMVINPGIKDWITHEDNELAHISQYPGDIWVTENTAWTTRVGATEKTYAEAQTICNAAIDAAKAQWTPESKYPEPQYIVLPS